MKTDHLSKTNSVFEVIYKISRKLSKTVSLCLFNITKALAIHLNRPELSVRKKFVQPLLLPWSYSIISSSSLPESFCSLLFFYRPFTHSWFVSVSMILLIIVYLDFNVLSQYVGSCFSSIHLQLYSIEHEFTEKRTLFWTSFFVFCVSMVIFCLVC